MLTHTTVVSQGSPNFMRPDELGIRTPLALVPFLIRVICSWWYVRQKLSHLQISTISRCWSGQFCNWYKLSREKPVHGQNFNKNLLHTKLHRVTALLNTLATQNNESEDTEKFVPTCFIDLSSNFLASNQIRGCRFGVTHYRALPFDAHSWRPFTPPSDTDGKRTWNKSEVIIQWSKIVLHQTYYLVWFEHNRAPDSLLKVLGNIIILMIQH